MKKDTFPVFVIAFLTTFSFSPSAMGNAVYKCISASGSVAYQPKPCKKSSKTDRIEIKSFVKPKTVEKKHVGDKRGRGTNENAMTEREKRLEERDKKECRRLKVKYSYDISDAKAKDKRAIESRKQQAKNRKERDRRGMDKYVRANRSGSSAKDRRESRRYNKRHYSGSNSRQDSDTHYADIVERNDNEARKKLNCKRFR